MTYISTTCAEVIIEVKVSGASSVDGTDCKQLPVSNQLRVPQWYTVQKNRKWKPLLCDHLHQATAATFRPHHEPKESHPTICLEFLKEIWRNIHFTIEGDDWLWTSNTATVACLSGQPPSSGHLTVSQGVPRGWPLNGGFNWIPSWRRDKIGGYVLI